MATKKGGWAAFPHDNSAFLYDGAALKKNWARLHKGDAEPFPASAEVQEAWRLYHAGDFQGAFEAGLAAGLDAPIDAMQRHDESEQGFGGIAARGREKSADIKIAANDRHTVGREVQTAAER